VDVNNKPPVETTTFIKQETSTTTSFLSAVELEEVIVQSAPDLIAVQQKNNQVSNIVVAATEKELTQQPPQSSQQQQQQQRQYNKQTSGTIQHGATLEHPSLRNKMRRYREANREQELTPSQAGAAAAAAAAADVIPRHFQEYINGIKYVEVESGKEGVKRYAAVIQSKLSSLSSTTNEENNNNNNNNNNYEPVTIRAWMMIVSSGTPIGNQAASELSHIIASSPFDSILFEVPGCNWRNSAMKPFEFVLVNEPRLKAFAESHPDRHAFEEHFMSSQSSCTSINGDNDGENGEGGSAVVPKVVCAFPNLGKDATLISPLPQSGINDATYSHLTSFLRTAPPEQITQFWKLCAKTYIDELKHKHERINEYVGTWFSTNGMGVAWLHLRLDSFPKYYSYEPFNR